MSDEEFYIGYLDDCPPRLARRIKWIVLIAVLVAVSLTGLIAARQSWAEAGEFEFGVKRTFEGVLYETPLPLLRSVSSNGVVTSRLLVASGKHGLPAFARGHHGEHIRFDGTIIRLGDAEMIEMGSEESFVAAKASSPTNQLGKEVVGDVVLRGELVDTKCWFGVMRPARGKVHRSCAVRCLSGGVPPGLLIRDMEGNAVVVLLTGPGGDLLSFDVQWAAREVEAAGRLIIEDGIPRLEVTAMSLTDD